MHWVKHCSACISGPPYFRLRKNNGTYQEAPFTSETSNVLLILRLANLYFICVGNIQRQDSIYWGGGEDSPTNIPASPLKFCSLILNLSENWYTSCQFRYSCTVRTITVFIMCYFQCPLACTSEYSHHATILMCIPDQFQLGNQG